MNWDEYFVSLLAPVAAKSKDPSTKVGCIIVGPDHEIRSTGYNDLPRGIVHTDERLERPAKYLYTEHAERNAIYNAARNGTSLVGSTIYCDMYPCAECARGIIQVGIKRLVCTQEPRAGDSNWNASQLAAMEMMLEKGIEIDGKI